MELTGSSSEVEYVAYEDVYGIGIEDMLHRIPSTAKIERRSDGSRSARSTTSSLTCSRSSAAVAKLARADEAPLRSRAT